MSWGNMCYPKSMGGLGFRRVRDYNLALLGKQVWRVMTEPQAFISKLLKARYFPNGTFRQAGLGSNPSYVWRSIIAAKDLILACSILKVGSGESIRVWDDPWIPADGNTRISTNVYPRLEDIRVNNLFVIGEKQWDHDLVCDIFNPQDAKNILAIPLSQTTSDDSWIWLPGVQGKYEVKSGYRVLSSSRSQPLCATIAFDWKKLWALAIPPKVKNFIWRALQNCLPTLGNLRRRQVEVYPICPVCMEVVESVDHVLTSCSYALRCWTLINTGVKIDDHLSFLQFLIKILQVARWSSFSWFVV